MSREWFYAKDRQGKLGPVSTGELREMIKTGDLKPTDMVWKQGMQQWTPISAVGHMPSKDASNVARLIALSSLFAGAILAVASAPFALAGLSVPGIVLAGAALLPGLFAVGVGVASRRNVAYLGNAACAAFVGLAALLFSIGATIARGKIDEARETIAKAAEVDAERAKAEAVRRDAKEHRERAEATLEEAARQPRRNAKLLEAITQAQRILEEKRGKDEAEFKRRDTALAAQEKEAAGKLALAQSRQKEANTKLDLAEKKAKEADERLATAEAKGKEAKDALVRAENKLALAKKEEEAAAALYRKIADEYKKLVGFLDVGPPQQRKNAIAAIARLGPSPDPAKVDLSAVQRALCATAVKGPETVRLDAVQTIKTLEPKLGPLVESLIYPRAAGLTPDEYVRAIGQTPEFGAAALPLIEAHLSVRFEWVAPKDRPGIELARLIFFADIEALGKMARGEAGIEARKMLVAAPESELARRIFSKDYREEVIAPRVRKLIPKP